jgi:Subtilase family
MMTFNNLLADTMRKTAAEDGQSDPADRSQSFWMDASSPSADWGDWGVPEVFGASLFAAYGFVAGDAAGSSFSGFGTASPVAGESGDVDAAAASAALSPTTSAAVGTGGSTALDATQLRDSFGVTGAGIKIGVLSDSFNDLGGAAADEADGALPANVTVLQDDPYGNGTDEGRAMLELAHQIAPGAQLYFATAEGGDQNFANNIAALGAAGCNIILDDVTYYDEPMFQEGVISQAIDSVVAGGAMYFTAAGNNASNAYQASWSALTPQSVTIGPQSDILFDLQWNEPLNAVTSSLDLSATGTLAAYVEGQAVDYNGEPVTLLSIANPTASAITGTLTINDLSGPAPGLVKLAALGDGYPVSIADANTGTVIGHAEDPNAITVAAAYSANDALESYSSSGAGTEWLFDSSGNPIAEPINKVDITGVDGITTTVPGGLSDFFGTSAATPTVAGVAALLEQLAPGASNATIEQALLSTATNLGDPATLQGAGLANALAAAETPLIAGTSETAVLGQQIALSQCVSSSDLAGYPMTLYQVRLDSSSGGAPDGSLSNGSTTLPADQTVTVSSLAGLFYNGGPAAGSDTLAISAYDGAAWSSVANVTMTDAGSVPLIIGDGVSESVNGNGMTVDVGANADITVTGSSDAVAANSGDLVSVNGNADTISASGSSGFGITGTGDTLTASNSGVTFGANSSGTANGSGLTVVLSGGGDVISVNGDADTISASGPGNETATANGSADTLIAGSGTTSMADTGSQGFYDYARGDGQATISNGPGSSASPSNELDFGSGIADNQLWLTQSGNDLNIDVMGSSSQVTVAGWYASPNNQLQQITAGGLTLLNNQVGQLVQAMATYSTNSPGFDPTAVAQAPNDPTVQNAIAAHWTASA